nr:hypothetical protein CFP56_00478 [Quercus suber]
MGNSASKERAAFQEKYLTLDKNYNAVVEKSSTQEKDLVNVRKELDNSKRESRRENDGLRLQLSELEGKFGTLQQDRIQQTEALKSELMRELQGQLRVAESLTMERNRARKEVERLKEEVQQLNTSNHDGVAKYEQENTDLKAQIERQRAVFQETLGQKEKAMSEKDNAHLALEAKAKEHEESAVTNSQELMALRSSKAQQEEEHAILSEQFFALQNKLDHSETRAQQFEQKSKDLSAKLEQSSAEIVEKEQRLTTLNEQFAAVRTRLDASEQILEGLRAGSDSASDELQAAKNMAVTQAEKHTTLANQVLTMQASLAQAEQKAKTAEESNNSLAASLTTSKASLEAETQRSAQLTSQLAAAQKSHGTTQAALANLQSTYNGSISKRNGLHEAFEAAKIELQEYHQSYKAQQAQLETVQKQLAASEAARKELASDGQGLRPERNGVSASVSVGA